MLPFLISLLSVSASNDYPSWFLQMPVGENEIFVVGYSPLYHYLSSSIEEAAQVARLKIATHIRDSIVGERAFSTSPLGMMYLSETIREIVDTSAIKDIEISIIDTAIVSNMVIILVTSGEEVNIPSPIISDNDWIVRDPRISGWIIETGTAPIYEYENNSWLAAEKDARISLAMSQKYHLEDLKKYDETSIWGVSLESVNYVISNVHTIARYVNRREEYCKVLMGIRK